MPAGKRSKAAKPSAKKTSTGKRTSKPKKALLDSPGPLMLPGEVPAVFLDANVLYTQYPRACILEAADAGLCRVHWTAQVLAEVRRNVINPAKLGKTEAEADHFLKQISDAFPDALVAGWEPLEPGFRCKTHSGDTHVAAGALRLSQHHYAGAKVILMTDNLAHLPHSAFAGTAVVVGRQGTVLRELLAAQPSFSQAIDTMCKRFKRPPVSQVELLERLVKAKCTRFAKALGVAWGFVLA